MNNKRTLLALSALGLCVCAQAISFSNFVYSSPFGAGASNSSNGNSVSIFTPNAYAGSGLGTGGSFVIQFDADMGAGRRATQVGVNLTLPTFGAGQVIFAEQAIELDGNGNEIGGNILSPLVNYNQPAPYLSGHYDFNKQVQRFRIKKSFTLIAPQQVSSFASVAVVNQHFTTVPEPATIAALSLGAALIARRRKKSA